MLLISATPSPFARKVRIALMEKGVEFTLQNEIPWHAETETPVYNPLEQLPILVPDDGEPVYEFTFILEWIEHRYPHPPLMPAAAEDRLEARRVQVLVEGVMDATALLFFEAQREQPSLVWTQRQLRKVVGGLRELDRRLRDRHLFVGDQFGLADIAVISVLGMQDVVEQSGAADQWRAIDPAMAKWQTVFPNLRQFEEHHRERPSVRDTMPVMFELSQSVV